MIKNKSFTLIELLVVIVIIGILAGVIIVSTSSSIGKANFAKAQAFSNTVEQELLLNLVSEWTFDNENNPGEDTWGNYDSTISGATHVNNSSQCVQGGCLSFDGINDKIPNTVPVPFSTDTITLWFKRSPGNIGSEVLYWLWSDGAIVSLMNENLRVYDGADHQVILKNLTDNKWHYLVRVDYRSPEDLVFYVDGGEMARYESKTSYTSNFYYWGADYNGTNLFFEGLMDEIRVYNAALSISQIKQNYIAGLNSLLANNNISKQEYDQRLNNLAYDKE